MTTRELTSVAIKVFAIYVFVHTLLSVPSLVQAFLMFDQSQQEKNTGTMLWGVGALSIIFLVILTVAIWNLANNIINKVSEDENYGKTISEAFILSIFGFYLAFEGLLMFSFTSVSGYMIINSPINTEGLPADTIAHLVGYFVQFIIGLTLVMRSNGWAALLSSLREAGLRSKPSNK